MLQKDFIIKIWFELFSKMTASSNVDVVYHEKTHQNFAR